MQNNAPPRGCTRADAAKLLRRRPDWFVGALAKARREGRLWYSRQGKRILYLDSWVLAWLEADARQEVSHAD